MRFTILIMLEPFALESLAFAATGWEKRPKKRAAMVDDIIGRLQAMPDVEQTASALLASAVAEPPAVRRGRG